jgi:lipoate-protein ligase A
VTVPVRAFAVGSVEPDAALAWDEALVRAPLQMATLLLWRTSPAVVIGRFQRADWEVDAAACERRGVRVWRRFTGGGAVHLDAGTLCIALAWPADHPWARAGVPEMYEPLLDGIVRACRLRGVDAVRDQRTVRVGGRKVTGIAAHRGRGGMLVHGTLLIDADLDSLRACLAGARGGDLQGAPRPAASRPDSVTNVAGERWEEAVIEAFAAEPREPGEQLSAAMAVLRAQKYHDPAWHAGSWSSVTGPAVRALLGPARSAAQSR